MLRKWINKLNVIINQYTISFDDKIFLNKQSKPDILMKIHNITPRKKKHHIQYYSRQLGLEWEKMNRIIFMNSNKVKHAGSIIKITHTDKKGHQHSTHPVDFSGNGYGIDAKYRVGSGDSKFAKAFSHNSKLIRERGLRPVLLILRTDNRHNPINRARESGYQIYSGKKAFQFVKKQTGISLKSYLDNKYMLTNEKTKRFNKQQVMKKINKDKKDMIKIKKNMIKNRKILNHINVRSFSDNIKKPNINKAKLNKVNYHINNKKIQKKYKHYNNGIQRQ